MKKTWASEAPSNIALIKYMGKKDHEKNTPENPSLSYTLPHLKTRVEVSSGDYPEDMWEPLSAEGFYTPQLGPKETARFIKHFKFLKDLFGVKGHFLIKSANNFPQNCGLASSASSFAALTKCSLSAFSEINSKAYPDVNEVASLSRIGSGSSCRSFKAPWCMWDEERILSLDFPYKKLLHMAVIAEGAKKKVSSSEAHKKVSQSLLYNGRSERALTRMGLLIEALNLKNWKKAYELCWSEFWDMHALFETSGSNFGYFNGESIEILNQARSIWRKIDDGPLVTMDAGPNVHLLFRPEQKLMAENLKGKFQQRDCKVFHYGF